MKLKADGVWFSCTGCAGTGVASVAAVEHVSCGHVCSSLGEKMMNLHFMRHRNEPINAGKTLLLCPTWLCLVLV